MQWLVIRSSMKDGSKTADSIPILIREKEALISSSLTRGERNMNWCHLKSIITKDKIRSSIVWCKMYWIPTHPASCKGMMIERRELIDKPRDLSNHRMVP